MLPELNFPHYDFRIRKKLMAREAKTALTNEIGEEIFDRVRKKFVSLSPEEWVRQHLLEFMIVEKKFPLSLLAVEKQLTLNKTQKRTDVLAYTSSLQPLLIAECKAPSVKLDVHALTQALRYNLVYNVSYLVITNGLDHYFFFKDKLNNGWQQGENFPVYSELLNL